jgi:hypothetical protein
LTTLVIHRILIDGFFRHDQTKLPDNIKQVVLVDVNQAGKVLHCYVLGVAGWLKENSGVES